MHERNIHKSSFTNFDELSKKHAFINIFLHKNKNGKLYYDFGKSLATYFLSKAILKEYYGLNFYLPYVDYEKIEEVLGHISLLSKDINNESAIIYVNDIEEFKNIILNLYHEYNNKLLNSSSEGENGILNNPNHELKWEYSIETEEDMNQKRFLCPCIPGRANYIHFLSDLTVLTTVNEEVSSETKGGEETNESVNNYEEIKNVKHLTILYGSLIKVLDIGVGANCIYPLLGNCIYDWSFTGVDINLDSLKYCYINILLNNKENSILLKYQKDKKKIFKNVINDTDMYFFSMCNPPFYSIVEEVNKNPFRNLQANVDEVVYFDKDQVTTTEAEEVINTASQTRQEDILNVDQQNDRYINKIYENTNEKRGNVNLETNDFIASSINPEEEHVSVTQVVNEDLKKNDIKHCIYNNDNTGGEYAFILNMINESSCYFYNVIWFSTLVSKFKNVKLVKKEIIKSMRMYNIQGKNQVIFLNALIKNNIHFNQYVQFQNVENAFIPVYISQYRIFESHTGRITRWIICWSYYCEEQINYIKKLLHERIINV
ncbi:hypothetical protein, conserved [Plasmodium gonderi]|uniref:Methyltransferase n=1 Tax=Plasmodium gonderi TaxID=77519 RepID=A0A1Y1JKP9_PLAGO|nr:hypothetical protein, conserved [Plasmodium gonderi]GAW83099.1 hypothetical protein, conserved [Plasmodium gonderi]